MRCVSGSSTLSPRRPTLAELRAVIHPAHVVTDKRREHWMGRIYMRRVSIHLTRLLSTTRVTPDGLTWGMVVAGIGAALVLTIPSPWATVGAVLLVQLQVLFDCSDGELARWQQRSSPRGVFIDRLGHYTTDAFVVAAVGVHADGGFSSLGGWTTVGLVGAVLVLVSRSETDLVHVARAYAALPLWEPVAAQPRVGGVRRLRTLAYRVPINRLLLAWDLSVVLLAIAVVDGIDGSVKADQILAVVLAAVGVLVSLLHLLTILTSDRLR